MVELVDLRAKITRETNAALDAEHSATGVDKSEIAREVLHRWAMDRIHGCRLLVEALTREGIEARINGKAGKARA